MLSGTGARSSRVLLPLSQPWSLRYSFCNFNDLFSWIPMDFVISMSCILWYQANENSAVSYIYYVYSAMNITSVFHEERKTVNGNLNISIVKDYVCWLGFEHKSLQVIIWKNKEHWKSRKRTLCPGMNWALHQLTHTINPLHAKFFRGNINIHLHFVSFLHIDTNAGSWNPSSNKTRIYLFYIVNIMAADVLAT